MLYFQHILTTQYSGSFCLICERMFANWINLKIIAHQLPYWFMRVIFNVIFYLFSLCKLQLMLVMNIQRSIFVLYYVSYYFVHYWLSSCHACNTLIYSTLKRNHKCHSSLIKIKFLLNSNEIEQPINFIVKLVFSSKR